MDKKAIHKSKRLARLLRHDPKIDNHGWRKVSDLVSHEGFTLDMLIYIVENNNKRRFEFSDDMTRIRARQGHSIPVDVGLEECSPPAVLYHGTAHERVDSILKSGICRNARLHVHLSATINTAITVGKRHGKPKVFEVDTQRMYEDGARFYKSRNDVWLTDFVDTKYLKLLNDDYE